MRQNLIERFGILLHRIAYHLIRRSLRARLRRAGMVIRASTPDFERIELTAYANEVCMECMEDDLAVSRDLRRIEACRHELQLADEMQQRRAERMLFYARLSRDTLRTEADQLRAVIEQEEAAAGRLATHINQIQHA
jgi:hypothetical protein